MINDLTIIFHQLIVLVTQYKIALLFSACVALGAGGAFLIAEIPFREYLLDKPTERSSHNVPTPTGGGALPVVLLLTVCFITFSILSFYVRKKIILKNSM